jgi:hypothetical protein
LISPRTRHVSLGSDLVAARAGLIADGTRVVAFTPFAVAGVLVAACHRLQAFRCAAGPPGREAG